MEAKKAFEEYEMYEEMRSGIKVRAKISNVGWERSKEIELIVDTGAIYTAIPKDILKDLGVVARGKRRFKTASGELKELPVGEAYIEIAGEGVTSIVAFFPRGATPLLGVTTLELLGLQIDPITEELRPMELLLLGLEM